MNKYRAWWIREKEMHEVSILDFKHEQVHFFAADTVPLKDVILMQSTGLKDKNGVEIFEGDVVNVSNHPFQKREDGLGVGMKINGNYEVGWNKEDLTYVAGSLLLFRIKSYISVVGNIHANPELLKEVE